MGERNSDLADLHLQDPQIMQLPSYGKLPFKEVFR